MRYKSILFTYIWRNRDDDDDDDDGDDDDDDDNNNNNNSPVSYSVAQTLLPGPQVTLAPSHSTDVETGKNFSTAN